MGATSVTGTGQGDSNTRLAYLSGELPKDEFTKTTSNPQNLATGIPVASSSGTPVVLECDPQGGNARGFQAVDLQCCRTDDTQVASGDQSFIAVGCNNTARGQWSHVEGYTNTADSSAAHAEGSTVLSVGFASHAEGSGTFAIGNEAHAEGFNTHANGNGSHAEGSGSNAGEVPHPFTVSGTTVTIIGNFIFEFAFVTHVRFYSLAGGSNDTLFVADRPISGLILVAGNTQFTITTALDDRTSGWLAPRDIGNASHAEGLNTLANGPASHAEGNATNSSGPYSHAEGWSTVTVNNASHAEGRLTNAIAPYSHAEGWQNTVSGVAGHVEGRYNTVGSNYGHAEGKRTTVSSTFGHAEGYKSTVTAPAGHAEGYNTLASGPYAHAEGYTTVASDFAAHAEGLETHATAMGAHAGGYGALASHRGEWARSSNKFATFGDAQVGIISLLVKTTDATPTIMTLDAGAPSGSNRYTIANGKSCACVLQISSKSAADLATFRRYFLISNTGGTTALTGAVQTIGTDIASGGAGAWTVAVTADNADSALQVTVTGAAATTINWVARLETTEVLI